MNGVSLKESGESERTGVLECIIMTWEVIRPGMRVCISGVYSGTRQGYNGKRLHLLALCERREGVYQNTHTIASVLRLSSPPGRDSAPGTGIR